MLKLCQNKYFFVSSFVKFVKHFNFNIKKNTMKNHLKLWKVAFILFATAFLAGCSSDEEGIAATTKSTIVGIATTNQPNLTTFVTALNRFPDLVATLNSPGNFTAFVPSNAAFTTFLASTPYATVNDVPLAALREILLNHVVTGSYTSVAVAGATTLSTGYVKTLGKGSTSTTNTLSLFVNVGTNVRLNGVSTVTTADVLASNGIVHLIDGVIGLPTIVTHAVANPNFSTLAAVVTSTGGAYGNQSAVATALTTNTTPLTVFAPVNAAFTAALAPGAWANGATATQITKVLQYHVTGAGNVLAATLTQGQVIPMITSPVQNTTIDLVGGAKIKDTQNISANIVVIDVQCANGVIHAVDKVLRPF